MNFLPDNIYHVYNQGNNKKQIFYSRQEYIGFLHLTRAHILPKAEIIAYCLMPNHFHFMVYADQRCLNSVKQGFLIIDPITNGMRKLLSGYTKIQNQKKLQSGSIFRPKTKAKCLTELSLVLHEPLAVKDYYTNCFLYIHQNPVKSGLVAHAEEWEYSSYRDYAGLRNGTMCTKILAEQYCGYELDTVAAKTQMIIAGEWERKIMY
jgi:REP element-mobilizing transposase RayT